MKSCVTIALVPSVRTGPWIFWDDLEAGMAKAAGLGFSGVELFTTSAGAVDPLTLAAHTEKFGLAVAAVGTGAGKVIHGLTLTDPDPDVRKRAIGFVSDMIVFGARFAAPAIIGSMQGNAAPGTDRRQVMDWLGEGLTFLGKRAAENGVKLIYEPLNRYETNLINQLEEAAQFVSSLDTRNISLLADLFHMNIEEKSLPDSIRACGSAIGHVHFADSNRRPIGFGHTRVEEIAAALREIDYQGFISAEAFPWPDPDGAAEQTMLSYRRYFG